MSIVAATGHRPNRLDKDYFNVTPLTKAIYSKMLAFIQDKKVTEAITGMALGIDQLWAEAAIQLQIPLTCVIPFRGQELIWSKTHQRLYHHILSKAAKIIYVHDEPAPAEKWRIYTWLEDRNQYMVDIAQELFAIYDGSPGGTQNCINYAKRTKPDMPIHLINPNDIRNELSKAEIT